MSKLFLIYIILNLSFIYNQSPRFNITEYIKGIVECVNTTENFSEMIKIKIINAYERNDNSFLRLIGEFLITNPLEMRKCLPKKPLEIHNPRDILKNVPKEIYQDEKFKDLIFKRYNWKGFLLCLQEKIEKLSTNNISESVNELITQINNEDYISAIKNEFRLRRFGNPIIIECHQKLVETKNILENE